MNRNNLLSPLKLYPVALETFVICVHGYEKRKMIFQYLCKNGKSVNVVYKNCSWHAENGIYLRLFAVDQKDDEKPTKSEHQYFLVMKS